MASAIDKRIGSNIRARRLELGISQEKLGDEIGVRFQQIQKYESGLNRVSASTLYGISLALSASVATFFEGLGQGAQR